MFLSFQEMKAKQMADEVRDDLLRERGLTVRKPVTCSNCLMSGHNKRSCAKPQREKPLELWERALINHRPSSLENRRT